jgi:energy-coupling factor transport system ATP-binding protein
MTGPLIIARDLCYRYPMAATPILQDLDFTIQAGEWVVLAGASGSGKSTLCRLLNGLIPHLYGGALQGQLRVAGADPRQTPLPALNRDIGLLLQRPDAQCLAATVARDIAFGPAWQGLDRPAIARRVRDAVERLPIGHLLERFPHTLSCGEQQRVALAGLLAMGPKLLVLDEPFAFLDAAGAAQLRELLRGLHESGITLIVAEHRLGELVDLASRLLVLHRGRLVADGAPATVLTGDLTAWGLALPNPDAILPSPRAEKDWGGGEPVIEWDAVHGRRDGRSVLNGVHLAVRAGEIVALYGANGAGKSTLLRHGNGLLRAERGQVRVLGQPVGRRPVAELAGTVGLVMQQPAHMLFAPTVRAELTAGPRALGRYDPAWCAQLSERFGLTALLERPPQTLSAGEQRRLAIAAVLAARPRVLLLDEPTAGQDAVARAVLRTILTECAADGVAMVVATHDSCWATTLGSRLVLLAEGLIQPALAPQLQTSSPRMGESGVGEESSGQHDFDPRAKLVVYLLYCLLIFLAMEPLALLPLLAAPLLGMAIERCWADWRRALRLLGPTLVLFALIVGLSSGPEAAFLLEGTLRFTPTMATLAREVRDAQESRGLRLDGVYLLRNGAALLGPVLGSVVRFADDLTEALEIRGFGGPARTPLADHRFRLRDWLLTLGALAGAGSIAAILL